MEVREDKEEQVVVDEGQGMQSEDDLSEQEGDNTWDEWE